MLVAYLHEEDLRGCAPVYGFFVSLGELARGRAIRSDFIYCPGQLGILLVVVLTAADMW